MEQTTDIQIKFNLIFRALPHQNSFRRAWQEIGEQLLSLNEQKDMFTPVKWVQIINTFKNLYLNNQQQQQLLQWLLELIKTNLQENRYYTCINISRLIGQKFHYLFQKVHYKKKVWIKNNNIETQKYLNIKSKQLRDSIFEILRKGFNPEIDFQKRRQWKQLIILMFYNGNKNLQKTYQLTFTIKKQQEQSFCDIIAMKGQLLKSMNRYKQALACFTRYFQLAKHVGQQGAKNQALTFSEAGTIHLQLGDYEQAHYFFQLALNLRKQLYGENSIQYSKILNKMGVVYLQQNKSQLSMKYFKQSIQIRQKIAGEDIQQLADPFFNIASTYEDKQQYQQAIRFYKISLQIYQKDKGQNTIECCPPLNSLAGISLHLGNYQQAIIYLQKSLKIVERIRGKDSQPCQNILKTLASAYFFAGNLNKALIFYQRSLKIIKQHYGQLAYKCVQPLRGMGDIYRVKGQYNQAFKYFRQCQIIIEKHQMKDVNSKLTEARLINSIGNLFKGQGKLQGALTMYKKNYQIFENMQSPYNESFSTILNNIAIVLTDMRKYEQAKQNLYKCISIRERKYGRSNSFLCAAPLSNLANVYYFQGDYQKALQLYFESLSLQEKFKGKDSLPCAQRHQNIGVVYTKLKKFKLAEMYLKKSVQIQQQYKGQNQLEKAGCFNGLGALYKDFGYLQLSLFYLSKSIRIYARITRIDSINCSIALNNIGLVLYKQTKYRLSLKFLKKSLDIHFKQKSPGYSVILTSLCRISLEWCGYSQIKNKYLISEAKQYERMAYRYLDNKQFKRSVDCFNQSLSLYQRSSGRYSSIYSEVLAEIAHVYQKQKNYQKSIQYCEKAIKIEQRRGRCTNFLSLVILKKAQMLIKLNKNSQAKKYSIRGCQILDKLNLQQSRQWVYSFQLQSTFIKNIRYLIKL